MHNKLRVFISSTSDLTIWRRAVAEALTELEIDGSLFEDWPSSPNDPIDECLYQIEESDAYIILLGKMYGSTTESGISVTHLEHRHAVKCGKPVFAYILKERERETKQIDFIEELENSRFRCKKISSKRQLKKETKRSFNQEFARCFRQIHSQRKQNESIKINIKQEFSNDEKLTDPQKILEHLTKLYREQNDVEIYKLSEHCENLFYEYPEIMNIVYMSESNLAMDGTIAPSKHLNKAIEFWDSSTARKIWVDYSLLYNQANALSTLKQYKEALEKYQHSLAIENNQAMCWKNLGGVYLDINETEQAINCFEKALERDPILFEALLSLARVKIEIEHDPESALKYLNRISVSNIPQQRLNSLHSWKAFAFLKLGDYAAGIANAENAINNENCDRWGWGIAGELYSLIRREDKSWIKASIGFWEKFTSKYPNEANAWAELGFTYWSSNVETDSEYSMWALNAFEKAIENGYSDDGLIFDRMGHVYQDRNNWELAEENFEKAVEKSPDKFSYCYGVSLIFLGRYEEALPFVMDAATKFNPDAMSWFQVAVCHEKLGFFEKAITYYKKAIDLDPQYVEAWFNLGGLYWNIQRFEEASFIWKESISLFPETELAHQAGIFLASLKNNGNSSKKK